MQPVQASTEPCRLMFGPPPPSLPPQHPHREAAVPVLPGHSPQADALVEAVQSQDVPAVVAALWRLHQRGLLYARFGRTGVDAKRASTLRLATISSDFGQKAQMQYDSGRRLASRDQRRPLADAAARDADWSAASRTPLRQPRRPTRLAPGGRAFDSGYDSPGMGLSGAPSVSALSSRYRFGGFSNPVYGRVGPADLGARFGQAHRRAICYKRRRSNDPPGLCPRTGPQRLTTTGQARNRTRRAHRRRFHHGSRLQAHSGTGCLCGQRLPEPTACRSGLRQPVGRHRRERYMSRSARSRVSLSRSTSYRSIHQESC